MKKGVIILLMLVLGACGEDNRTGDPATKTDTVTSTGAAHVPPAYQSKFVRVNGIRLHYLDWGGTGPALVMIHGIFDSPHIFDDLASRLKDQFRVIAYARRGHGQSDAPAGPYDLPTMVEDLRQLLDSLGIQKAHFLGWSMGGNEITQFAGLYPSRVEKLIYLESGYDWTNSTFLESFGKMLTLVAPDSSDLKTMDSYKHWFRVNWLGKETAWSPGLEAYIYDIARINTNGQVIPIPEEKTIIPLFASLASPPRDYSKVKAPVLSLYSTRFFPADVGEPALTRQLNNWDYNVVSPFRVASIKRLKRQVDSVVIQQIDHTTHMSIGVHQPDSLALLIREFLTNSINRT